MADGDVSAQDLLKRLDKYHDKLLELTSKTEQEVITLRNATEAVNRQRDSFWERFKYIIQPTLCAVLIVLILIVGRQLDYCKISIESFTKGGVERCR